MRSRLRQTVKTTRLEYAPHPAQLLSHCAGMSRYGVTPNMLVMPPQESRAPRTLLRSSPARQQRTRESQTNCPASCCAQMMLYMALAPEAKLTYALGGPAAEARFEAGVAGFEARSFRGCGIMTSEPFEVSDGAPREDGEFVRGGRTHAPRFARRRPGLRADADAQQPGGRVLRHAAAAGRSWQQEPPHLGHAHLRRGVGPPRAHHLGRGLGRVLRE